MDYDLFVLKIKAKDLINNVGNLQKMLWIAATLFKFIFNTIPRRKKVLPTSELKYLIP